LTIKKQSKGHPFSAAKFNICYRDSD